MIDKRPFAGLGGGDHGWLKARHHFSFANYYDPKNMGWGALRVWNDDEIAANSGFPPHPHADMEIITYVRKGAITHKDSLGNEGRTEAGDVQVEPETTTLFQIWIEPDQKGGAPSWGARPFPKGDRAGKFVTLASGLPGDDDALPIRSSGRVAGATLKAGETTEYVLGAGRHAYLVSALGSIEVNGVRLDARDGAAIRDEAVLTVKALEDAEVVLVDAA
jgi:redox-sensitive bicupin YhaK (pirin superfamily)